METQKPSDHEAAARAGAVWASFCAQLQRLGDEQLATLGEREGGAEALRLLGRHLATALDWCLTADPDYPRFTYLNNKGTGMAHEDICQLVAPVRGDAAYRLSGNVRGLFDINVSAHDGPPHRSRNWGNLGLEDIETDGDGNFTLMLSRERVAGNWLELRPETATVSVRQYCYDWSQHRPGWFEITRIGSEGEAPPRASLEQTAERLAQAPEYVRDMVEFLVGGARQRIQAPVNTLSAPASAAGGSSHVCYGWGHYALAPDEALIIEFSLPRARQWSIEWLTATLAKGDAINRQTSLNGPAAHTDADGRVRFVVGMQDPGVQNWLDVGGYPRGILSYRWIDCIDPPQPSIRLVKFDDVRATLPADTPVFGAAARALQQAVRRRQMAWRGR